MDLTQIDVERHAMTLAVAIGILVAGFLFAGWAASLVRRLAERAGLNPTLTPVLAKVARIAVLLMATIAALDKVGIDTTSLLAALGAAGLAIGLALKGTIADIAAGLVLIALRPFDVGDAVDIGGTLGTVVAIDTVSDAARVVDGVPIVLGNSAVRGSKITNYSRAEKRRIDLAIRVGYDQDLAKVKAVLEDVLQREPRILTTEPTLVNVNDLAEGSVQFLVRGWTAPADFFDTQMDLRHAIKERLATERISIPLPQRDIRIIKGDVAA